MIISKKIEIDMGHRVPNHKSKCRNPHGHRYTIELFVDGPINNNKDSSDEGMVFDFSDLKKILENRIIGDGLTHGFDHSSIYYHKDQLHIDAYVDQSQHKYTGFSQEGLNIDRPPRKENIHVYFSNFIPTAENLAKFWLRLVKTEIEETGLRIHSLKVWETPNSTAIEYDI